MARTKAIFEKVFALPLHSPATATTKVRSRDADAAGPQSSLQLVFESVESGILDKDILASRQTREAASLRAFSEGLSTQWQSFRDLHDWLFAKHNAYASSRLTTASDAGNNKAVDAAVLQTY
jgi:hypothetical protein